VGTLTTIIVIVSVGLAYYKLLSLAEEAKVEEAEAKAEDRRIIKAKKVAKKEAEDKAKKDLYNKVAEEFGAMDEEQVYELKVEHTYMYLVDELEIIGDISIANNIANRIIAKAKDDGIHTHMMDAIASETIVKDIGATDETVRAIDAVGELAILVGKGCVNDLVPDAYVIRTLALERSE